MFQNSKDAGIVHLSDTLIDNRLWIYWHKSSDVQETLSIGKKREKY